MELCSVVADSERPCWIDRDKMAKGGGVVRWGLAGLVSLSGNEDG